MNRFKQLSLGAALAAALVLHSPAQAHRSGASEASVGLSALPVAISVVGPSAVLSAGVVFTVIAVEASAEGAMWVLENVATGVRCTVRLAGKAVGGVSVGVGTAVTASAVGAGMLLSAAGTAIAFIPNEVGKALLYNERVTR